MAAILQVAALAACRIVHVPFGDGVETAAYVVKTPQKASGPVLNGDDRGGLLYGQGPGWCVAAEVEGRYAWAFEVAGAPGRYQCFDNQMQSPILVVGGSTVRPSAGVFGEYRCGMRYGELSRVAHPDGSEDIAFEEVPGPCETPLFPGPGLPFYLPTYDMRNLAPR